jgi:hypothetical protein
MPEAVGAAVGALAVRDLGKVVQFHAVFER